MFQLALILVVAVLASAGPEPVFVAIDAKYSISTVAAPYIDAYATCKKYGLTLAMERTVEDTKRLDAALTRAGANISSYFLGGFRQKDAQFEPTWIWLETGEVFSYTNWHGNIEPDSADCLFKVPLSSNGEGTWSSSASNIAFKFICENPEIS